jgi:hypothetical protein
MTLKASSRHPGHCSCSDLLGTTNRVYSTAVFLGGKAKDFLRGRALWWKYQEASTLRPPWHPKKSEVSLSGLSRRYFATAQPAQDYEQMVNNATKELSDPLAEIVLDARSHGR